MAAAGAGLRPGRAGRGGLPRGPGQNLIDLYQAARGYDAAYLAAKSQFDAAQFKADPARSLQRPPSTCKPRSSAAAWTRLCLTHPITARAAPLRQHQHQQPGGRRRTPAPLQPRATRPKSLRAEASLTAAEADLKMAEDDLVARLAQGYFDVLSAQDVLATAKDNKKALAEQLASAKRSFEVGNSTITDTA